MIAPLSVLCLLGVVATLLALSVKRIPEGQVYTLRRGRHTTPQLLSPGTHLILPLRDHIAHKISLAGRALQLEDSDTRVHGTVYWQVLDPGRADAVIDEADTLIRRHALDTLLANTSTDEKARNVELKHVLNHALRPQGMLITRVDLHTT